MNREEAMAHGLEVHETKHSMKRRCPWHDYRKKGTYMLTLVVEGRVPLFGELKGNAEAPLGFPDAPRVECSELGRAILKDEIGKIGKFYPQVEVWKVCIMPDHIHMIVRVKEYLPEKKHLGMVVKGFKTGCSRAWWRLNPLPSGKTEGTVAGCEGTAAGCKVAAAGCERAVAGCERAAAGCERAAARARRSGATVPSVSPEGLRPVLFEAGYNDKILLHEGQLDNWKAYLDDNPRRLLLKRQNPELFTVLYGMEVAAVVAR